MNLEAASMTSSKRELLPVPPYSSPAVDTNDKDADADGADQALDAAAADERANNNAMGGLVAATHAVSFSFDYYMSRFFFSRRVDHEQKVVINLRERRRKDDDGLLWSLSRFFFRFPRGKKKRPSRSRRCHPGVFVVLPETPKRSGTSCREARSHFYLPAFRDSSISIASRPRENAETSSGSRATAAKRERNEPSANFHSLSRPSSSLPLPLFQNNKNRRPPPSPPAGTLTSRAGAPWPEGGGNG